MKMISFEDFAAQGNVIWSIRRQIREKRLVHAIMISGEPGTGKRTFAALLARSLLCTAASSEDIPCGKCEGCMTALSGEHPDLISIRKGVPLSAETKKGRATVPVEDIREMIRICSQHSYLGGNRVVLVEDAEDMTPQAQNCLLKILEEPPQDTYFILTSCQPARVLITIRSRCRPLKMKPWAADMIRQILISSCTDPSKAAAVSAASDGSIGKAIRIASDEEYWKMRESVIGIFFCSGSRSEILKISSEWKDRKADAELLLSVLENVIHTMLDHRLNQNSLSFVQNLPAEWISFSEKASLDRFAFLSDRIHEARKQLAYNVNFQAVFEQLLLSFLGEYNQWVQ